MYFLRINSCHIPITIIAWRISKPIFHDTFSKQYL